MHSASAAVGAILATHAHHGAETSQQAAMHAGVARRLALRHDAKLARPIDHLGINVIPLGKAQDRQMTFLAPAAQFAPRAFACRAVRAPK
jgi:hypothetical protein